MVVVFEAIWRSSHLGKALKQVREQASGLFGRRTDQGSKCPGLRCNWPGSSEEQRGSLAGVEVKGVGCQRVDGGSQIV